MDHEDEDLLGLTADTGNQETTTPMTVETKGDEAAVAESDNESSAGDADDADTNAVALSGVFPDGLSKKEAKKSLSKADYKLWKKANSSGKKDKKKDKKDKKKSSGKDKKEKGSSSRKSGKKRGHDDDDEDVDDLIAETGEGDNFIPEEGYNDGDLQARKKSRRDKVAGKLREMIHEGDSSPAAETSFRVEPYTGAITKKKKTPLQRRNLMENEVREMILKMQTARKADTHALTTGQGAPINRLLVKDQVMSIALNAEYEEILVEERFLDELTYWLMDPVTKGPAPLDLRTAAINLLMNFGFKGSRNLVHRKPHSSGKAKDEVSTYEGIDREALESCKFLGMAINYIRQNERELPDLRNKACVILERLSRAWADRPEFSQAPSKRGGMEYYPSKGKKDIAGPYQHITTEVEAFRKTLNHVNPLDPDSYHRVPPMFLRQTPLL